MSKVTELEFSNFLDELYALDDVLKTFPLAKGYMPTFNTMQKMALAQGTWEDVNDRIKPRIQFMSTSMRAHLAGLMHRLDFKAEKIHTRLAEIGFPNPVHA